MQQIRQFQGARQRLGNFGEGIQFTSQAFCRGEFRHFPRRGRLYWVHSPTFRLNEKVELIGHLYDSMKFRQSLPSQPVNSRNEDSQEW